MTAPGPLWLLPTDVQAWLGLTTTDPLLSGCAAAVEPQVMRARPDMFLAPVDDTTPAVYAPDGEVYQAAVMLAARLYRRRNSPGGIESFADSLAYVSRYDPEIERALRVSGWRPARVG